MKFIKLILILPFFAIGQGEVTLAKGELTKVYAQAITDFIKEANAKNKVNFDTLFFINRKNNEPDDFPDIELPKTLANTQIRIYDPVPVEVTYSGPRSRININLIGWVNKEKAEFMFVVFTNGYAHQYDYKILYRYNTKLKVFELEKLEFIDQPKDPR